MEIVSYPDLRNAEEARIYAEAVQQILRYSGVLPVTWRRDDAF